MPPTPLQKFVRILLKRSRGISKWKTRCGIARERSCIIASTKKYLEFLSSIKVEIEELEDSAGPR